MGAIDMWCNPFTHEGIQHLFIDNEEVHFMMGTQWGRTGNMVGYTAAEFVANMDRLGVEKVCVPALKQAFYRKNKMGADFSYDEIGKLVAAISGSHRRFCRHQSLRAHGRGAATGARGQRAGIQRCARTSFRLWTGHQCGGMVSLLRKVRRTGYPGGISSGALGGVYAEPMWPSDFAGRHRVVFSRAQA